MRWAEASPALHRQRLESVEMMSNLTVKQLLSIALLSFAQLSSTHASELDTLFGEWGTENQCARGLITPKGTKHAAPFEISKNWLGHGDLWCRLTWIGTDTNPDGQVSFAYGQCGEDAVRDFQIKFKLEGDELSLIWNTFHKNGPVMRCEL